MGQYIEAKYLWPLVGVFLGWLLTAVTAGWHARRENKKIIGKLLAKLFMVSAQLDVLIAVTENYKTHFNNWDSGGWINYERRRKNLTDKHFLEGSVTLGMLREAITDASAILPTRAVGFDTLMDSLGKVKGAAFEDAPNVKSYIYALSGNETILTVCSQSLRKEVLSLAFIHSPITYAKVLMMNRRRAKGWAKNKDFFENYIKDSLNAVSQS